MATFTFQKGDKVCTHSLNSTAYNSLEGTVLDGPQVGGKYQVRLSLSNGATQDFHLKQSNLELVARGAAPAAAEESGPRGITKWAEEEVKRVAANPPPPWVTEGLAPEFAADGPWPTQVVLGGPPGSQEHSVKNMLDNCFTGAYSDVSIVCHEGYLEFDDGAGSEPENHSGMTPLMMVGLTADIPAMRAVLWSGADVNFQGGPDRRTALWLLCGALLKEGDSCGTAPPLRSRFRAVEFLLLKCLTVSRTGILSESSPSEWVTLTVPFEAHAVIDQSGVTHSRSQSNSNTNYISSSAENSTGFI